MHMADMDGIFSPDELEEMSKKLERESKAGESVLLREGCAISILNSKKIERRCASQGAHSPR
jgi:hydrogenase maturation factor